MTTRRFQYLLWAITASCFCVAWALSSDRSNLPLVIALSTIGMLTLAAMGYIRVHAEDRRRQEALQEWIDEACVLLRTAERAACKMDYGYIRFEVEPRAEFDDLIAVKHRLWALSKGPEGYR